MHNIFPKTTASFPWGLGGDLLAERFKVQRGERSKAQWHWIGNWTVLLTPDFIGLLCWWQRMMIPFIGNIRAIDACATYPLIISCSIKIAFLFQMKFDEN